MNDKRQGLHHYDSLEICKSRPETRLDKSIISWQGLEDGNITFAEELDFEVEEIRELLDSADNDRL